ncbi:FIST N-terminal domain-containing protein [Roseivivax isoporae]|uniref:GfdT protein n=1 Tax=Roseivivax isoporae LMG 25204 TaxID=1449351 RepID=X7F987_9RHOB|nr:FIST N-terminal domain-containing protein [Roseivivax isoporae]ETX28661.1 GfdT protein [Roseivivax isoporae LMG 25204]
MTDSAGHPSHVRVGLSHDADPARAVAEAAGQFDASEACFVLAFVPEGPAHDELAEALARHLPGIPVFGCTTAGQITTHGYDTDALLLLAFPRRHFRCASLLIEPLKPLSIKSIAEEARRHDARFQHTAGWSRLGLIFADGLSKQEDVLVSTLQTALEEVPIFGGSAGNGLDFRETFVLHGNVFRTNAALLVLLETDLGFKGLGFDHFLPTDTQMVVTDAVPEERLVLELNGAPAAPEYARLIGCPVDRLSPQVFAENPILVRQNMAYHVRAIQGAPDGLALSFLSAIDDGLLLTLGRGKAILETLDAGLDVTGEGGRTPDFILGFDCVLRKLEIEQKQLTQPVSEIFRRRRVLGFNTYGEQHRGVHVNQTFVGVAFFEPRQRQIA